MDSATPRERRPEDVLSHHRSAMLSLAQSRLKHRPWRVLLTSAIWEWLGEYLRTLTLPRRKFPAYAAGDKRAGVYEIASRCTVALASDWGTGTRAAFDISKRIAEARPDYTIHLGDVYYSGTTQEFEDYFFCPGGWPSGSERTFVLNANHEMYSGGQGYFGLALQRLGQATSYFSLRNDDWIILGLDTGYYARIFPLLEFLLKGWIRLHDAIKEWLAGVVFAQPDGRSVVVLTHHQWFSAFDTEYGTLGKDLAPYLDRVAVWFWGHEHRLAGYAPYGLDGKQVRARCIGHGGMPIELGEEPKRDRPLVFLDERRHSTVKGKRIGFCGYVLLHLDGPRLSAEYRDQEGTLLLTEEWTRGDPKPRVTPTPHLTLREGRSWDEL